MSSVKCACAASLHTCTCASLATMDCQSTEDALRRRREWEIERRAPVRGSAFTTPTVWVSQHRLRDREHARERLAAETAEEREAQLARRHVQGTQL